MAIRRLNRKILMKYVKSYFQEYLENPAWGFSTWYFELDDHYLPQRQVVIYDSGPTLKMDRETEELSHIPIDTAADPGYRFETIDADAFEAIWQNR